MHLIHLTFKVSHVVYIYSLRGKAVAVKAPVVIWQTRPLFNMSVNNMSYTAVTLNNGKAVKLD
ncbi:hypothetical protein D3C76_1825260 [compost metagenome]